MCCVNVGNIMWVVIFGWWLSLCYIVFGALVFITIVGIPYGYFCFRLVYFSTTKNSRYTYRMAKYIVWPFGSYLVVPERDNERVTVNKHC